jgi:hypothetical protein
MMARALIPFSCSTPASRAQESTVSHMTSTWPEINAVNLAEGSSISLKLTLMPFFA